MGRASAEKASEKASEKVKVGRPKRKAAKDRLEIESSSLHTMPRPVDPEKLPVWAANVRERLTVLESGIQKLESEKQVLLSLLSGESDAFERDLPATCSLMPSEPHPGADLWAAARGLSSDALVEMSSASSRSIHPALEPEIFAPSPAATVLSSEEEKPETDLATLGTAADLGSKDSSPLRRWRSGALRERMQQRVSAPELLEDKLEEVSEKKESAVSSALPSALTACDLDLEKMSEEELQEWMQFFGLKASNSRDFMLRRLHDILDYMDGGTAYLHSIREAPTPVRERKRKATPKKETPKKKEESPEKLQLLADAIRKDKELYESLLTFQPLEVSEVKRRVVQIAPELRSLGEQRLRRYLDSQGFATS